MNSDHWRKFELECMRLASGCIQLGDDLGTELKSEILRLAGEHSTQQWPAARRKLGLNACAGRQTACSWWAPCRTLNCSGIF